MADLQSSFLQAGKKQKDKAAPQLSAYNANQKALQSLGKKDKSQPHKGLLTKISNELAIPGNLIRSTIAGNAPQFQGMTESQKLKGILSGNIQVGTGDIDSLRVNPNEGHLSRAIKLGGAFVGDVLTDPLSYVSSPSSLSRKAGGMLIYRHKDKIFEEASKYAGKDKLINEFYHRNPEVKLAKEKGVNLEKTLKHTAEDKSRIAKEEFGNHITNGFVHSRGEMLNRLEKITGSKENALKVFEKFPEEVKGGIILTSPLGKPLKDVAGKYTRLTPGTGEMFGKLGKKAAHARLTTSVYPFNLVSSHTGHTGQIYSGIKKSVLKGEEGLGADTWQKLITSKDELAKRGNLIGELNGNALSVWNAYKTSENNFAKNEVDKEQFSKAAREAFHNPLKPFEAKTEAEVKGYEAGKSLRDQFGKLHAEQVEAGINIGKIDPATYVPLILKKKEVNYRKLFKSGGLREVVNSTMRRDTAIKPDLTYMNPMEANEKYLQEHPEWAKEHPNEVGPYHEDPKEIYINYVTPAINRIANNKFIKALEDAGVVHRSEELNVRMLNELNAQKLIVSLGKQTGPALEATKKKIALLEELTSNLKDKKTISDLQDLIIKHKIDAANGYITAQELHRVASQELRDAKKAGIPNDIIAHAKANEITRENLKNAKKVYENSNRELAVEKIDSLDHHYSEYSKAVNDFYNVLSEKNITIKNMRFMKAMSEDEVKAYRLAMNKKLKDLEDIKKEKFNDIKETLKIPASFGTKEIQTMAKELLNAAQKLSHEEFVAFDIISKEEKLEDLISKMQAINPVDKATQDMIGDIVNTYSAIRMQLPAEAFKAFDNATNAIYGPKANKRFIDARNGLIRYKDDNDAFTNLLIKESKNGTNERDLEKVGLNFVKVDGMANKLVSTFGVKTLLENIYKSREKYGEFQKGIKDILDPLLGLWKISVTVGRGFGYMMTNVAGGIFANLMHEVSAVDMKDAIKHVTNINKEYIRIQKENPNMFWGDAWQDAIDAIKPSLEGEMIGDKPAHEVIQKFFDMGGFNDTEFALVRNQLLDANPELAGRLTLGSRGAQLRASMKGEARNRAEQVYRHLIDLASTNKYQRTVNTINQSNEQWLRLSAFIDGYKRYGDYGAAMDKSKILHFDYQDLSEGEQWIRRLVPFYTWTRNNVPAQFRILMMQPGKIQRFMYANEEFQNMYGAQGDEAWMNDFIPEYLQNMNGFVSDTKFADNNIGFFLKLPFEDLNNLFQIKNGLPAVRGKTLAGMLGPISGAMSTLTGTNLGTGNAFPIGGQEVPGFYNLFRAIPGSGVYMNRENQTFASPGFATGLENALPFLGTVERTAAGINAIPKALIKGYNAPNILFSQNQQNSGLSNLLNVSGLPATAGVGSMTITPAALKGEISRRTKIQNKQIAIAADKAGVDPEWIKKEIAAGKTPQQIAIEIRAMKANSPSKAYSGGK